MHSDHAAASDQSLQLPPPLRRCLLLSVVGLGFSIGVYPGLESDRSYLRSVGVLSGGCVSLLGPSVSEEYASMIVRNSADESSGLGLVTPMFVFFLVRRVSFSLSAYMQNSLFGLADFSRGPSASSDALALLGPTAGRGMRP